VWRRKDTHKWFWLGKMNEKDRLENLGVDGCSRSVGWNDVRWIHLTWVREKQSTFGHVVMSRLIS